MYAVKNTTRKTLFGPELSIQLSDGRAIQVRPVYAPGASGAAVPAGSLPKELHKHLDEICDRYMNELGRIKHPWCHKFYRPEDPAPRGGGLQFVDPERPVIAPTSEADLEAVAAETDVETLQAWSVGAPAGLQAAIAERIAVLSEPTE